MPDFSRLEDDAPARRVLYLGAILLVAIPVAQVISQIWPLELFNIQWRFQAANALSSILLLPFLGLILGGMVARSVNARGVSKFTGVIAAIAAVSMAASTVLFLLDALQLKAVVTSRMTPQFNITMVRVLGVTTLFTVAYALVAITCLKMPSSRVKQSTKLGAKESDKDLGLIIGQDDPRSPLA